MYKCTKETHDKCENNAICHLCDGESLYKNTKEEKAARKKEYQEKQAEDNKYFKMHKKEKKEGMAFEKRVVKAWNDHMGPKKKKKVAKPRLDSLYDADEETKEEPVANANYIRTSPIDAALVRKPNNTTQPEARRQKNSGALWYAKGDIVLEHALLECKERGTVNARGEKQITIPKQWLDKQAHEAYEEGKPYWYLPFAYKNDDGIYLVKPFEQEMELIAELRRLKQENESLKQQANKGEKEND